MDSLQRLPKNEPIKGELYYIQIPSNSFQQIGCCCKESCNMHSLGEFPKHGCCCNNGKRFCCKETAIWIPSKSFPNMGAVAGSLHFGFPQRAYFWKSPHNSTHFWKPREGTYDESHLQQHSLFGRPVKEPMMKATYNSTRKPWEGIYNEIPT